MKTLLRFIIVCLAVLAYAPMAYCENGPTPKVIVGTNGIADGSVTPEKLEPSASYAFGSASITAGLDIGGFTTLGDARIKVKILDTTLPSTTSAASAAVAHGLTGSKIRSITGVAYGWSGLVPYPDGSFEPASFWGIVPDDQIGFIVYTGGSTQAALLSAPVKLTIIYEE